MAKSDTKLFYVSNLDIFTFLDITRECSMKKGPKGQIVMAAHRKQPSKSLVVKMLMKRTPEELAKNMRAFFNEVQSTARLKHPNIVSEVKSAVCQDYFAICTNYYPLGNLAEQIPGIARVAMEFFLSQIACAVHYIHCQHIAHLDLNPRHVLIDARGNAIITDFGSSRILLKPQNIIVSSGLDGFRAPEVDISGPTGVDPFKVDVYAIGVILWNMLYAIPPNEDAIIASFNSEILMKAENQVFRDVLLRCLDRSATRRWSSKTLALELHENLPAMTHMIGKLMNHDSLPVTATWISAKTLQELRDKIGG